MITSDLAIKLNSSFFLQSNRSDTTRMIYRLDSTSFGDRIFPLLLSPGTQFGAARRDATRRIVWDSGVAVWDACVALALRRSPCTPALLRATDGDESTRRRASSFLVASGRGCYTLSVRSTTPN